MIRIVISVLVALLLASPVLAQPMANPDFTAGEAIPDGATHDWNLGPTGLRGWMHSHQMQTTAARQVKVTTVDPGSPAEKLFEVGDVILGVDGKPFSFDPRVELGKAIGDAEAGDGKLHLTRWRDGQTQSIAIQLQVLGRYSPTAPFDCPKSSRIFEQGCDAIARQMRERPNGGNPIQRSYNALALLASGDEQYLPLVRQQVEWASTYADPERRSYHSWFYGPINLLVAEYVSATGDTSYLPQLERLTMDIVRGQSPVGSWGHRFVQDNGRLAGYGMMNAPGVPLTTSLVLARQAGVSDPQLDEAIDKSTRLLRFYVGKGSIPYGDHHPWTQAHDDNGKNGIAAILFHLVGDEEAAGYFSKMSVASYGAERDEGHTGNFFNLLWAMPGVAISGPQATGAWTSEFGWYYDLARRWDGTFQHQGPPQPKPDSYRGWDVTGPYLLAYAQARGKLFLTGRKQTDALHVDAETASELIEAGRDFGPRAKPPMYADRSEAELFEALRSWSPIVRERAAQEIGRRKVDASKPLIEMLGEPGDLHAQLGACQALIAMKARGAAAVPKLTETLDAEDLWLRIKAAEALASIGEPAMEVVPKLLTMLAEEDREADPRGMQQRYLIFALFNRRDGMLGRSLEGVDRDLLNAAVRAGLDNQDGRARGSFESVYRNFSYEEIEPLLPAIHQAVVEPAPSGIMFADGIRLSGLEVLAEHRIAEGVPLCIDLIDVDRWGMNNRIKRCLAALRIYGGAARSEAPRLRQLKTDLAAKGWTPDRLAELDIDGLIEHLESDGNPPNLRSL